MSTSSRAVRSVLASASPLLRRRALPRHIPAVALLVPLRHVSTETHTVGGPPSGPPPGFNAEAAKKPLPPEKTPDKQPASAEKPAETKDAAAMQSASAQAAKDKDDKTLSQLAAEKQATAEAKAPPKKEEKKLTIMQRVKKEILHYWDGTKLLAAEVRISTRLALKMAAGYELSRRENRQLQRTVQDLGRLVPFSVFVIVPFAEVLLPVALRLFPNLLPSTYEAQKSKDDKAATLRATRKEVSSFLQQTLKETGLPLTVATTQKEEFSNFFRKLRATGEKPTAEDVIKVCKIFRDDLTLDNLSRPQLVSMCRYMNLGTFGTDTMLRYQVRHRMRQIKRDDRAIWYEGVDSLTPAELQLACAARGVKTYGVSTAALREDLQAWLDLRLKYGVPSTLLVLSNAYMYGQDATAHPAQDEFSSQIEALMGVLSSIPEELYHEVELEVHHVEATNKQRLEVLREQQELIEEENQQDKENEDTGLATPRDVDNIDEKEERRHAAEAHGAVGEKDQVSEAVDAEADRVQLEAEKQVRQGEKQ